jgi:hypothetical protein
MRRLLLVLALLALARPLPAAEPTDALVGDALRAVFGTNRVFTATGRAQVSLPGPGGTMVLAVTNAMSGDNLRFDLRPLNVPGGGDMDIAALLGGLGMDQFTLLGLADGKGSYVVYPGLKAYAPVEPAAGASALAAPKIARTSLGQEIVAGRKCEKQQVTITTPGSAPQSLTVWNAPELRGFPMQIEMAAQGATVRITYGDVRFAAPPAAAFAVPAGYERHGSVEEMMQAMIQQAMQDMLKRL